MARHREKARIQVDLPVRISGFTVQGSRFVQDAIARNISSGGGLLSGIDHELSVGDLIDIQYGDHESRFMVVQLSGSEPHGKTQVAVRKLEDELCSWNSIFLQSIEKVEQESANPIKTADALQQSETNFKVLFETSHDATLISRDGLITDCNRRAEDLFRCRKEDIIGHSLLEFSSPKQPDGRFASETLEEKIQDALQDMLQRFEWELLRQDGLPFRAEVNLRRVVTPEAEYLLITILDMAEWKSYEESLKLFRLLVDQFNDAIQIVDLETMRLVEVNERVCANLGYTRDELLSMHVSDIDPSLSEAQRAKIDAELLTSGSVIFQTSQRRKDGSIFPVEVSMRTIRFDRAYTVCAIRDITERKQAEEALRRAEAKYRQIFEEAVIGIFQTTPEGRCLSVNSELARIFGYDSAEEMMHSHTNIALSMYVDPSAREWFKHEMEEKEYVNNFEYQAYRKDGSKIWLLENARVVRDASGAILYYEGTVADITDRKAAQEKVQYMAYYDVLTGLPNRALLQNRLKKALASARRQKGKVALLFLDLDRFKNINDSFGHSIGDLLLQDVAERLRKWVRENDTVARLGGDEFLIVLTDIKDIADAAAAAERLMATMAGTFAVRDQNLGMTCSIGISIYPENGVDCETLIKNADAAMYSAKAFGRNGFRFFTTTMNAEVMERLAVENSLRTAIDHGEFFLVYQPQMDIDTGSITGLEVLLRWRHPKLGLVPPDKFIRIAEESGQIVRIGEWVFRTACSQARKWQDEGLIAVPVAVNVSAVQFRQKGFSECIARVLRETHLDSSYLELELTESLLLSSADMTFSVLQELRAMGIKLSIDDFGTGYSSLSYLKHLPVSKLKIDRSFVRDIASDPDDAAIASAIISMAKHLNLKVIAEGVEDEAQMSFLRTHQCDEIQGYYFCRPLAADEATDMLRKNAESVLPANLDCPMKFAPASVTQIDLETRRKKARYLDA